MNMNRRGKLRVLIIESDEGTRYLYDIALRFQSLEVKTSETMNGGLALIKEYKPALILLDRMVPDFESEKLASEIKSASLKSTPAIVVTNLRDEAHKDEEVLKVLDAFEHLVSGKDTVGDVIRTSRKAVKI